MSKVFQGSSFGSAASLSTHAPSRAKHLIGQCLTKSLCISEISHKCHMSNYKPDISIQWYHRDQKRNIAITESLISHTPPHTCSSHFLPFYYRYRGRSATIFTPLRALLRVWTWHVSQQVIVWLSSLTWIWDGILWLIHSTRDYYGNDVMQFIRFDYDAAQEAFLSHSWNLLSISHSSAVWNPNQFVQRDHLEIPREERQQRSHVKLNCWSWGWF